MCKKEKPNNQSCRNTSSTKAPRNQEMEKLPMTAAQKEEWDKWMVERNIEEYMEKAERAGPEHAQKSENWLLELRQWQTQMQGFEAVVVTNLTNANGHANANI